MYLTTTQNIIYIRKKKITPKKQKTAGSITISKTIICFANGLLSAFEDGLNKGSIPVTILIHHTERLTFSAFEDGLDEDGALVMILISHADGLTFSAFEDGLDEDGVLGKAYCHAQDEVRQLPLLADTQVGCFLHRYSEHTVNTHPGWTFSAQ